MSDQQDPNSATNSTPNLPDLQSAVDAALGSPAPTPTSAPQDTPNPLPPAEPVAPVSVPDMPQLPSEPVAPPTTPVPPIIPVVPPTPPEPEVPSSPISAPMTDETPLAFAGTTPSTSTPTPTPVPEPMPEPMPAPAMMPPADLPPVAPAGEVKPKKGMNKVVAGIAAGLFLVFGLVGGLYAFGVLKGVPPQIAKVTEGDCSAVGAKCPTGYSCKSGVCLKDTTGGSDGSGNGGGGGGRTECVKDTDCGASGWSCQSGQCVSIPTPPTKGKENSPCTPATDPNGDRASSCDASLGLACSCPDLPNTTTCKCKPTGGQQACFHTICPTGYTCVPNGGGTSSYCVANSPKPKPSDVATPKPSPSPISSMACTGLTASKTNPSIGDAVTFTCLGTVSPAGAGISYKFRYSTDGGTTWNSLTTKTGNTTEMKITACGSYTVQCQACATLNGVLACDPKWVGVQ